MTRRPLTEQQIATNYGRAIDHASRLLNAGEMSRAAFEGFLADLDAWLETKFDELHRAQLRSNQGEKSQ